MVRPTGPSRRARRPLVGITCEVVKQKPFFAEFDLSCDYRYVRAILRAGGTPVLLPINPLARHADRLIGKMDGLVIVGGADIHPSFYGEKTSEKVQPMYRGRTYFEMRTYRAAQKHKIPVLAICYGMQLLNIIHGGTLHRDIPSELTVAADHRSKERPLHRVHVQKGSLYHEIFRRTSFVVHSEHHQAIKELGRGLRATVISDDGIIEAIEGPPRTIAVQWHPERQPKDPVQVRLFRYFVRLCGM
jgi:gamma-glutamyl-gamma-aminobutyrate hydrolase PuuD